MKGWGDTATLPETQRQTQRKTHGSGRGKWFTILVAGPELTSHGGIHIMSSITERLPLAPRRIIAAALLAAIAILATALPASATTANFNNVEGCSGTGTTSVLSVTQIRSRTDAWAVPGMGSCGWVYQQGEYRQIGSGTWHWVHPTIAWYNATNVQIDVNNVYEARNVAHSACNAGGTCPGSWPGRVYTQYP